MKESELYLPIKSFLEKLGYSVQAEVKSCDLVAVRGEELLCVEMKTSLNLTLLLQGMERKRITDAVYLAIPRPKLSYFSKKWRSYLRLLKQLELGLIVVSFTGEVPTVQVALEQAPYTPKRKKDQKTAVLREIDGRSGDYNTGGVTREKLMTAYRENALQIACALSLEEPLSSRQLRKKGTCEKTSAILRSNVYGWFLREGEVYSLSEEGRKALTEYPEITEHFLSQLQEGEK